MARLKVLLSVIVFGMYGTAWAETHVVCASVGQWPPMEFVDENDKMTGYTLDFMEAAGKIAGFTIEFREVPEKDIVANLRAGEFDAVCSSMINQSLRREELDFSVPYFLTRQLMVAHDKRVLVASRGWAGMRVGARTGSYGMEAVREFKDATPREYDAISRAMEDVYLQTLDVAVCDEPVARYYTKVKYNKGLKVVGDQVHPPKKPLSVAVEKGNEELLQLMNRGISTAKARGIDRELQRKWFSRR